MDDSNIQLKIDLGNEEVNVLSELTFLLEQTKYILNSIDNISKSVPVFSSLKIESYSITKNSPLSCILKTNRPIQNFEKSVLEGISNIFSNKDEEYKITKEDIKNVRKILLESYKREGLYSEIDKDLFDAMPTSEIITIIEGLYFTEKSKKLTSLKELSIIFTIDKDNSFSIQKNKIINISNEDLLNDDDNTHIIEDVDLEITVKTAQYETDNQWKVNILNIININSEFPKFDITDQVSAEFEDKYFLNNFQSRTLPENKYPLPKDIIVINANIFFNTAIYKENKKKKIKNKIKKILIRNIKEIKPYKMKE